jgi:hypothetical protein
MKNIKLNHTLTISLSMGIILFLIQACNLTQTTQSDNASGSEIEQTVTAIFSSTDQADFTQFATQTAEFANWPTPTAENTIAPTATQQPTETATSTTVNVPSSGTKQIEFKPGGTSAYDRQTITAGQEISYQVTADKDQTLIVSVSSPNNDVYLNIKGAKTGQTLVSSTQKFTYWYAPLPATQNYLITLTTTNASADYFLSVEVPANITFGQGKDSISINGHIDVFQNLYPDLITRVSYLAYANAGQTLTVNITSPNIDSLSLGLFGQSDGQPYKRYEVKGTSATLQLPATQGYYIKVYSTGGVSTDFTMDVTIK